MMRGRLRSLQVRLALRLAALYIAGTAVATGVLIYQAYDTATSLYDRELSQRAEDLSNAVLRDSAGAPRLELSQQLASSYANSDRDIFAVRDRSGRVLGASPLDFGQRVAKWPRATDEPSYFHLSDLGSGEYYGLSVELGSVAGPVSISVARAAGADALVRSLLREFVFDVAWVSPGFMIATLAMGFFAIRSGLKPVQDISRLAAAIGPEAISVRLPAKDLPLEIAPLVDAVNRALDRLEQGFAVQREFTANAAHELRTPLSIVTGALDTIEGIGDLAQIREDVGRMNRLVEQLLRVARLDAVSLELKPIELNEVVRSVVAAMAPWAIAQRRRVAFVGSASPVQILANDDALADAVRNLIENGLMHSPPGEEVVVIVHADGCLTVEDRGSGVPVQDREKIFDRFWRAPGTNVRGAGLGLAIVREIMKAHRGSVTVEDHPGGGARFVLAFPLP